MKNLKLIKNNIENQIYLVISIFSLGLCNPDLVKWVLFQGIIKFHFRHRDMKISNASEISDISDNIIF